MRTAKQVVEKGWRTLLGKTVAYELQDPGNDVDKYPNGKCVFSVGRCCSGQECCCGNRDVKDLEECVSLHKLRDIMKHSYRSHGIQGEIIQDIASCPDRGEPEVEDKVVAELIMSSREESGYR